MKTLARERRLARWIVGGLLCGGCATPAAIAPQATCDLDVLMAQRGGGPAVGAAPGAAAVQPMPLNSVNITDGAITNKVVVQATTARRTPTGTVEVWARFVNCTDFPLQIEGRTHFLDEGRAPVEPVSAWNRVHLPPRAYGVYSEASTDVHRVRFYFVEVREGR